jgi:predicted RNA methylase
MRVCGRPLLMTGTLPSYMAALDGMEADGTIAVKNAMDLPPGATILDVGANIGQVTVPVAAARPDCRVFAFEPIPVTAECLRRNVRANGLANVK